MKFRSLFGGLLLTTGLIAGLCFLHAQNTATFTQTGAASLTDTNVNWNSLSDLEVELKLIEAMPTISAADLASQGLWGTFYSVQHLDDWPPLPGDIPNLPVWEIDTNLFLIDDTNFDYAAQAKAAAAMSGVNGYGPLDGPLSVDYGTNLWIAQFSAISNNLTGILSNTIAGVYYDFLTNSDLTSTQWETIGLGVYGSEVTNWTAFSLPMTSSSNLFIRARSWISSDGSGLPDWWEILYFSHTSIDPVAFDPAGDGWTVWQDFEAGYDPTTFHTPPAPEGVSAQADPNNPSQVTVTWQPANGPVTGYTIGRFDYTTYSWTYFTVGVTNQFVDTSCPAYTIQNGAPIYMVQAIYAGGDSSWSDIDASPYSGIDTPYVLNLAGAGGATVLVATHIPFRSLVHIFDAH